MLRRINKCGGKVIPLLFMFAFGIFFLIPSRVMAFGAGGSELQVAYSTIQSGTTGYWGMTAALIILALGLLGAWEMKKPIIFLAAVVAAILIPNLPSIISGMGACF